MATSSDSLIRPAFLRWTVIVATPLCALLIAVTVTNVDAAQGAATLLHVGRASSPSPADDTHDARPKNRNIIARWCDGALSPADPMLRHGDQIAISIGGFAALSAAVVRVAPSPSGTIARTDAAGVLRYVFQVPDSLDSGRHLLVVNGAAPVAKKSSAAGNFSVSVPNIGLWRFRVSQGAGAAPARTC